MERFQKTETLLKEYKFEKYNSWKITVTERLNKFLQENVLKICEQAASSETSQIFSYYLNCTACMFLNLLLEQSNLILFLHNFCNVTFFILIYIKFSLQINYFTGNRYDETVFLPLNYLRANS